MWALCPVALIVALAAVPMNAESQTLEVGPGQEFSLPSQAAVAARDGDVVHIGPGNYVDCAIWSQNELTIEATGASVVLSGKSCDGKAIFVINGNDVTVQGSRTGVVIIRDSFFAQNGTRYPRCPNNVNMHALYVGLPRVLLRVERSEFVGQHDGHHVKSRAQRGEIFDNVIRDGEQGTGSYLINIPDGGSLIARGNRLEKGPHSENRTTIAIGEEHQNYLLLRFS
jgi:hypothetical protein